jgi:hypothetical protein
MRSPCERTHAVKRASELTLALGVLGERPAPISLPERFVEQARADGDLEAKRVGVPPRPFVTFAMRSSWDVRDGPSRSGMLPAASRSERGWRGAVMERVSVKAHAA